MVVQITNSITLQLINTFQKKGTVILSNLELRMQGFVLIRELIKYFAEFI